MGGAAHAHVIGSTCESAGPRARRGTKAASTPRQTAPLKLSAHTWSSFAHTPGIWGYSYSHDETTTFNVDFPAPTSRKVTTKPTRFVHPSSWLPPPSIPTFPHQQAEKSPQNQHVLSFNPQVSQQHKLEGAGPEADPFEYPINTVQVFRCAPFLGSPLVGVALGLMTINVRTPPVGTIERSWQFPENFSPLRSGSRLRTHNR